MLASQVRCGKVWFPISMLTLLCPNIAAMSPVTVINEKVVEKSTFPSPTRWGRMSVTVDPVSTSV